MVADEPFRIMGDLMLGNGTERLEQFLLGSSHHPPVLILRVSVIL